MTKVGSFTRRTFIATAATAAGAALLPTGAAAKTVREPGAWPPEFVPERVILSIAADPAHTQAVTWRTKKPTTSAQAQIALATADPGFEKTAKTVVATATQVNVGNGNLVGQYAAKFEGLVPYTRYSYRVGDGEIWSEWNDFSTASDKPDAFRFLYVGDEQNSIRSLWSRSIRAAYAKAPDARFIVHAGDLLEEGYDDQLWGEWCDALSFVTAMVPSLPVPGNHDLHRAPGSPDAKSVLSVSPLWRCHFVLPTNGPEGLKELNQQSYYVDYQGVRLISLDVNVYANESFVESERQRISEKQTAWLEKTLSDNPNPWTIVVQHQPIYTVSKERDYVEMRAVLAPLYDRYHVDLVLQGHDHAYARTQKLAGGKIVSWSQEGTIYVISVSGPKMYEATSKFQALMAEELHHTQLFQVIDVDATTLVYRAYSIDGEIIDEFHLHKDRRVTRG